MSPDFMGTFLHAAEDPNKDGAYISQCKSQGDLNKCFQFQTCSQWAFPYLWFIKGTVSFSCLRRVSVSGFDPFLSVLVFSVSPRLSHPLALRFCFAFPRCIRRVKAWSEHIHGNPLFAWWTYLFTPGSPLLEVITPPKPHISASNYRFCSSIKVFEDKQTETPFS